MWSTLALWETARQARFQYAGTHMALLRTWMGPVFLVSNSGAAVCTCCHWHQVAAPQAEHLVLPSSRSSAHADCSVAFQKAIDAASAQATQGVAVVIPEGKPTHVLHQMTCIARPARRHG